MSMKTVAVENGFDHSYQPWQLALVGTMLTAVYGVLRISTLADSLAAAFLGEIPERSAVIVVILILFTLGRYGLIGGVAGWLSRWRGGQSFWLTAGSASLTGVIMFFVANIILRLPLSGGQIVYVLVESVILGLISAALLQRVQRFEFQQAGLVALLVYLGAVLPVMLPNDFQIGVVKEAYFLAILASSWALLAGVGGQFSFAHLALVAVATYTSGLLGRDLGVPPVPGIIIGTLMAGFVGLIIGVLCLPLRRAYLALFTIAFAEIFRIILVTEFQYTEGSNGLQLQRIFPVGSGFGDYYVLFFLLVGALVLMYALVNSRFGMFWRAIREDQEAAAAMGVDVVRYKILLFVITSMLAGLAGATFFHTITIITPTNMELLLMSTVIAMAVIGSLEILLGAAVGAFVLHISLEMLREIFLPGWAVNALVNAGIPVTERVQFGTWRFVLFGLLLMLTLRFARNGLLFPLFDRLGSQRRARQQTVDKRRRAAALATATTAETADTEVSP